MNFRQHHPSKRILLTKVDAKSAYRRLHYHPDAAVQAMIAIGDFVLVALRMTFGGAPNPSQWSDLSEMGCDLAIDLVRNDGWDPAIHVSPHQPLIGDRID